MILSSFIKSIRNYFFVRKFYKHLKNYVQTCYRMGYDTDEIVNSLSYSIDKYGNDEFLRSKEYGMFIRNLPRLVSSWHPVNPTYFEKVP